jgi:hypothetical protein
MTDQTSNVTSPDATELPLYPSAEISLARLAANRANALKSTGPKSPEGKRRSSLNATRSRLHGQIECLPAEDLAVYHKLLDEVIAEHKPVGPTERFHATSAAQSMWRLHRAAAIEQGIFASGFRAHVDSINAGHPEVDSALATSETFIQQARALALLTTYESRIRRSLEKDLASLRALQSERKAAHYRAENDAIRMLQYTRHRGEAYDPGDDFKPASAHGGFVFSKESLEREISRRRRFDYAWRFSRNGKDPAPRRDFDPEMDLAA